MTLRELTDHIPTVAAAFGVDVRGRMLTSCPACGAERRSGRDSRPPVNIFDDDTAWHCFRCDSGGSSLTLAALASVGEAKPASWKPVHDACVAVGLVNGGAVDSVPAVKPQKRKAPSPSPPRRPLIRPAIKQLGTNGQHLFCRIREPAPTVER